MNRLFIELYLDEDVDILAAELLRRRGFSVETTHEANRLGSTDDEQFSYAILHGKTFVTHNRVHFEALAKLYASQGLFHHGIIIASRRRVYDLVHKLLNIINQVTADEMENQIRYI